MGADGLRLIIYNTFKWDKITASKIFKSLKEYCVLKKRGLMDNSKCFMRIQWENELFKKYYADLGELIKKSYFKDIKNALLWTQIMLGIYNKDLQARLLWEDLPRDNVVRVSVNRIRLNQA